MPPMANHGLTGLRCAAARTSSRPGAGRPGFVGHLQRQVILSEVQDVGARRACDIGPVVHGEQRAVPPGGVGEHLQGRQLAPCLQRAEPLFTGRALVPELDDVDPAGQYRFGELGQIAAFAPRVGAQVEPGRSQPVEWKGQRCAHPARLLWTSATT